MVTVVFRFMAVMRARLRLLCSSVTACFSWFLVFQATQFGTANAVAKATIATTTINSTTVTPALALRDNDDGEVAVRYDMNPHQIAASVVPNIMILKPTQAFENTSDYCC
jgi:hypothetical protein